MNCDDFLPAIETGGVFARFRARRHASGCARCAAAYARFSEVKRQWSSDAVPLSHRERHLWTSAATAAPDPAMSRRRPLVWSVGLAAACVVTSVVVFRSTRPDVAGPSQPSPVAISAPAQQPVVSEVTVAELVPAREFDALSDAVDRLDADLVKLRHDAERLAARQQLAMTLERFGSW